MQNEDLTINKSAIQDRTTDPKKLRRADHKNRLGHGPQVKLTSAAAPETKQPDTSGWLTRNQSADLLKMSVTTIANYERRGKLHPRYAYRADSRGIEHHVAVYDPEELTRLPRSALYHHPATREPGEIAARAFELFNQGVSIRDVLIELRETPDRVHELHERWLDMGGADLTITKIAKEAFEKLVGPFSDVAGLLSLIAAREKRKE